ncbi:hypothetical protein BO94DRAFT_504582 [Aspergillus sclerotioniger CBS 115572]|uniref:Protein SQS1 n=1 Tax=Aspergillus sclerotioniger CBS 115572 TaxID=1450535 RepID=A0A317UX53_9EURO|nr:hypothetical protein BO94DRAFT_504582 [Aspergillus sclerotioniger CBS 115572]PWY65939.1 hypothetical protein BO94DRAFT_504582 [Aspergillus sclerotioniger CBS 115572]
MTRSTKAKSRNRKQRTTADDYLGHHNGQLTMQQEARNTEGRNLWRTGASLRHQTVRFVSAQDPQPDRETEHHSVSTKNLVEMAQPKETLEPQIPSETMVALAPEPILEDKDRSQCIEVVDHISTPNQVVGFKSQTSVDSSEDEIVFRGRRNEQDDSKNPSIESQEQHTTTVTSGLQHRREIEHVQSGHQYFIFDTGLSSVSRDDSTESHPRARGDSIGYISLRGGKQKQNNKKWERDEDDILADYIQNIDDDYLMLTSTLHPTRGQGYDSRASDSAGSMTNLDPVTSAAAKTLVLHQETTFPRCDGLTPEEKHESDGTDTSFPGQTCREAAAEEGATQNQNPQTHSGPAASSGISDTEDEEKDGLDVSSKSSIGRGKVMLQSEAQHGSATDFMQTLHTLEQGFFASATAFADALEFDPYYGFDIMDFNRPSVKKKPKGKNHALDITLSDSELESELINAWQNDRAKKKARKQKREELRSQGLLGRSREEPVLKTKYTNGIGFEDLKTEFRKFLSSSKNSLALPPMSKQHRKLVHELANALSLSSQSRGKGSSRFPIVHKTSRTPAYTPKTISQMDRILFKRYSQRGTKSRDMKSTKSIKSRRDRPDASVSYMDGDVVGGSAPEIGAGNKGRAMLEKMGWSTGTPLGATNNKGILLPVAHVVKNSRAGLG